jgi:hypothetical protein
MTQRSSARLAWSLWAVTVCEVIAFGVLTAQRLPLLTSSRATALQGAFIGLVYPVMGALIASKRPRNPIGWIFIVIGVSAAASAIAAALATDVPRVPDAPAGAIWGLWLNQWVWALSWLTIPTFVLLLFPDGRLPHPRFRPVAWLAGFAVGAAVVGGILSPDNAGGVGSGFHNPVVVLPHWVDVLQVVAIFGWLVAGLGSLVALVYRFRRSRGDEREQLKWFVFASIATVALYFGLSVDAKTGLVQSLGFIAIPLLPTATAIAILRYRLYDVDRIISRTVSYGIVTAVLVGAYVIIALIPTTIFGTQHTPTGVIAAATLVAVALFRPVRRRVQGVVDRRFNRRRYDAAQTIDVFTARLRDEVDIETLKIDRETLVLHTMEPEHVSLWLTPKAPIT